jgi:lysophospholipase L1-like esterase
MTIATHGSIALLTSLLFTLPAAAQKGAIDRWEKEVAAMEARDAKQMPPQGGVLFIGSSSIRLWDLKKSFPDLKAVNHGFGGSQTADSVRYFERLVTPVAPKTIVLYAGDNDIAAGKSPEQVANDFAAFHSLVRKMLPETRLIFLPIKPSPSRWKMIEKQREANRLIREQIAKDPKAVYVEIEKPMLGEDGQPRPELFRDDKLHMTEKGYEVWTSLLTPLLK